MCGGVFVVVCGSHCVMKTEIKEVPLFSAAGPTHALKTSVLNIPVALLGCL